VIDGVSRLHVQAYVLSKRYGVGRQRTETIRAFVLALCTLFHERVMNDTDLIELDKQQFEANGYAVVRQALDEATHLQPIRRVMASAVEVQAQEWFEQGLLADLCEDERADTDLSGNSFQRPYRTAGAPYSSVQRSTPFGNTHH
jgi:hypothetical protein